MKRRNGVAVRDPLYDLWTFRPFVSSPPGQFAPKTFRPLDVSHPGRFAIWTFRPQDVSPSGRFAPWTFRHLDVLPPRNGRFAPLSGNQKK